MTSALLFFAGVVALSIAIWYDVHGMRLSSSLFALVGAALMLAAVTVAPARAHDHNHPEMNDWLKSLHAKNRTWCCDGNDTDAIEDWGTKGDGYRVKFRGQWFDVPEGALVDGPNNGGVPLLWMNKGYMGASVRCFMPGSMT